MIKLGEEVRDVITGFEGIVIARSEYLSGRIMIEVQPKGLDRYGEMQNSERIDEQRLNGKEQKGLIGYKCQVDTPAEIA